MQVLVIAQKTTFFSIVCKLQFKNLGKWGIYEHIFLLVFRQSLMYSILQETVSKLTIIKEHYK
jgi:hypothetical protein